MSKVIEQKPLVELNIDQINTIQQMQKEEQFATAYLYLRDIVAEQQQYAATPELAIEYDNLKTWLDRASSINSNDGSFTSELVRGATRSFAESMGINITEVDFQNASNKLAFAVLDDVIKSEGIPHPKDIITRDVQTAVKELGIEPWGWAGTLGDILPTLFGGLGKDYQSIPTDNWRTFGKELGRVLAANASGLGRSVSSAVSDFFNLAKAWVPHYDPLILDLDGNGLDTIGLSTDNPIYFDHDGDGIKTLTGWIKPTDGFLVLDRNSNGMVDNGTELFGDATALYGGGKAADGFAALAQEDTNGDGVVNHDDANWNNLRVWRDLNQDGISQANELFSLNELGIASLNVAKNSNNTPLENGNIIADLGSYTRADGTEGVLGEAGQIADVDLVEDTFKGIFTDPIPLADDVKTLPDMGGSGKVRRLREAASIDNEAGNKLTVALAQFSAETTRQEQMTLLDELIYAWGDTSTMETSATPANLSASDKLIGDFAKNNPELFKKIIALERFNGTTIFSKFEMHWIESGGVIRIFDHEKELIEQSWSALKESVYSALVVQTRLKKYLDTIDFTITDQGIQFDTSAIETLFAQNKHIDAANALIDLAELTRYAKKTLDAVGFITSALNTLYDWIAEIPADSPLHDTLSYIHIGSGYKGTNGDDILLGENESDYLAGGDGSDVLYGRAGDDILYGDRGDDLLYGGTGNDYLSGGAGNNVFLFSRGDGQDFIASYYERTANENSVLKFTAGITQHDVVLTQVGYDMIVSIRNSTDKITIENFFYDDKLGQLVSPIQQIQFSDGTAWNLDKILAIFQTGTAGDDTLRGTSGDDTLYGGMGNDSLYGKAGDDTLYGDEGDDQLYGDDGNDTLYGGMENDTLEGGDGDDRLFGEAGIDVLTGGTGNDQLFGGDGDDTLYGGSGDDVLSGGAGIDYLDGGAGNNTYLYSLGDGQDYIAANYDRLAEDFSVLKLTAGIAQKDIILTRSGSDLIISFANRTEGTENTDGADSITVQLFFYENSSTNAYNPVQQIEFSDGSVWNLATIDQKLATASFSVNRDSESSYINLPTEKTPHLNRWAVSAAQLEAHLNQADENAMSVDFGLSYGVIDTLSTFQPLLAGEQRVRTTTLEPMA